MDVHELLRLTDYEFEVLCKDVFELELGRRLEIFGPGKDQGVDLRYVGDTSETVIIQCKHWIRTGAAALLRHYRVHEASKVLNLQPSRYIIATSAELTPATKSQLVGLLQPSLHSSSDVWGGNDIVEYLESHPEVVQKNIRLWLTSSTILRQALTYHIGIGSRTLAEEIQDTLRIYVPTTFHARVERILAAERFCLITGNPGAGKSTLARAIAASFVAQNYELVDASYDLRDIDRAWQDRRPQVFYIDDILGQTSLDDNRASLASRIMLPTLRRLRKFPDKVIVMTSRDYIAAQASERHDVLAYLGFDTRKCQVNVDDLSPLTRARILYHAVYFSDLSRRQKREFCQFANYRSIINHPGFSPRLIDHAIAEATAISRGQSVVRAVLANLENPERLWETIVEHVLGPQEIGVVLALYSLGVPAGAGILREAWRSYMGLPDEPETWRMFRRCMRRLEETLIREVVTERGVAIRFFNASVQDYLQHYVSRDPSIVITLAERAVRFFQLHNLWQIVNRPGSESLQRGLQANHSALLGSAKRLLHSEAHGDRDISLKRRCWIAMQYANAMDDEELSAQVVELTEGEELLETDDDHRIDLADVATILNQSNYAFAQAQAKHLAYLELFAMDAKWVGDPGDLDDIDEFVAEHWTRLSSNQATLEKLAEGGLDVEERLSEITRRMTLVAKRYLAAWQREVPPYVDEYKLSDVLDWARFRGLKLAGTARAQAYLDNHERKYLSPPSSHRDSVANELETAKIEAMFAAFDVYSDS